MALKAPYRDIDVHTTRCHIRRCLLYTKYTSYRVLMSMVRHSNKSTEVSRVLICRNYGSVMNEAMVQMKLGDEIEM